MTAPYLLENLLAFGRTLRRAGIAVGTDKIAQAASALTLIELGNRSDVRAALAALLITRRDQRDVFDVLFDAYWRAPDPFAAGSQGLIDAHSHRPNSADSIPRRASDALQGAANDLAVEDDPAASNDLAREHSAAERLRRADFESMTEAQFRAAQQAARHLELGLEPIPSRRRQPANRGAIDRRATLHWLARRPMQTEFRYSAPRRRIPRVVILLDISGSMERYARVFLHFAHGLSQRDPRTQTLAFGTRLTHLSRALRHQDPDRAMAEVSRKIPDWTGGTRIATNLRLFNHDWARRLLTGNATLLLVSDGLDRDDDGTLDAQAALLSRYAREIVWLNPLLRFSGFEPKAAGIKTLLRHVDRFLPFYNLDSLHDLSSRLGQESHARTKGATQQRSPARRVFDT